MPTYVHAYCAWIGIALLSLIFLANALGIIDQERAVRELANAGLPRSLADRARALIGAGRVFQLVAVPALFFGTTRAIAAFALSGFLALATIAAHGFWRAKPDERGPQLANFLKNLAAIGGLLVAAGWEG
jgi:uncharacterized membrane protein YphA (DoxX/SURF4 family)